ncbi:MAG TPA: hypothetical protein VLZ76_12640 [Lysobacter sp.]|jgi:hypothetical protein|nr:hypothetical protein [Lysobacter sp.]
MSPLIVQLRKARTSLIRAYIAHVVWFSIMCTFAALRWSQHGLKWSVLLTLATVPPVLIYTVRVHRLCRAIDPAASTVGWIPVLVTTVVLSPFESGLVLPVKNLLAANGVLKRHAASTVPAPSDPELAEPDVSPFRSG